MSPMKFKHPFKFAALAALLLAVAWLITATWGVSDVVAVANRNAQGLNQSLGPLNRFHFDPDASPSKGRKEVPWYFIGNASSPFPFIVAVDVAFQIGSTAGQRSRHYVFWCCGSQYFLYQRVDWMS